MESEERINKKIFSSKEELIKFLINSKCFKLDESCNILTEHVGRVCHYLDLREISMLDHPEEAQMFYTTIGEDINERYPDFDILIGIPEVGANIAAVIAMIMRKRFKVLGAERADSADLYEHLKELKRRGLEKIVLFDDVCASGRSMAQATLLLKQYEFEVLGGYAVYDKKLFSKEHLEKINLPLDSYFTFSDLIKVGLKSNILSSSIVNILENQHSNLLKELKQENWNYLLENVKNQPLFEDDFFQYYHIPFDILEYYASGLLSEDDLSFIPNLKDHINNCPRCSDNLNHYKKILQE